MSKQKFFFHFLPQNPVKTCLNIEIVKQLKIYLIILSAFLLISLYLLCTMGYINSFLFINSYNHPFLDSIMPYITEMGNSLLICSIFLILFSKKDIYLTLTLVFSVLGSGLLVLFLKHFFFSDWHRPLTVLRDHSGIHSIKGFVEYYDSFPSGHSTTAGSAFLIVALILSNRWILVQAVIALACILVCYSRIYLASHFLGDVFAGLLIGSAFSLLCMTMIYPLVVSIFEKVNREKLEKIKQYMRIAGYAGLAISLMMFFNKMIGLSKADEELLLTINGLHTDFWDTLMWWASSRSIWIPLYLFIVILIIRHYKKQSIYLILILIVAIILADQISAAVIKPFFERLRPSHNPLLDGNLHFVNGYRGGTFGFVSSHASNVFALAFFLFFIRKRKIDWKIMVLILWATFVSYSRIYLGVHYPSDIIGGMLLGLLVGFVLSMIWFNLLNRNIIKIKSETL